MVEVLIAQANFVCHVCTKRVTIGTEYIWLQKITKYPYGQDIIHLYKIHPNCGEEDEKQ